MNINSSPFSLSGKDILISGASSGIGRSIAVEASKMGAHLIITGQNYERLQETFSMLEGEGHILVEADLTDTDQITELTERCGLLNGVVHCAGALNRSLLKNVKETDIRRIFKINFEAPVLLQKALMKKKAIKPSSSIVFIASRAPFAPAIGNGLYAASKAALMAYAKVLALELAPKKIRVNSICPAMVKTKLTENDALITGVDIALKEKEYPLGRYGMPEDIAYMAIYLLSDAASWVTGSDFDITGGGEFTLKA